MTKDTKDERLNSIFGIESIDENNELVEDKPDHVLSEEEIYIESKLKKLIDLGIDASEELRDLATDTQEPRSFEVLSTLLKNTADMTLSLMQNRKTKKEIELIDHKISNGDKDDSNKGTTNNMIFVGTLSEILDSAKNQSKLIDEDVIEAEIVEKG